MIRVIETGRNPTMRYLHRTHRVSVGWLHERFSEDDLNLVYELTSKMAADIYTKAFTDAGKWEAAQWLINIVDPARVQGLLKAEWEKAADEAATADPPLQSGGTRDAPNKKSVPLLPRDFSFASA